MKKMKKIALVTTIGLMSLSTTISSNVFAKDTISMERQQAFYASATQGNKDYSIINVETDKNIYAIQGQKISYLIVNGDEGVLVGADLDVGDYSKFKASIQTKVSDLKNLSVALTDSREGLSNELKNDGAKIYQVGQEQVITLDNNTPDDKSDDVNLKSMAFSGHTECSTIWMDETHNLIFSGDALGDGTLYLRDTGFCMGDYNTTTELKSIENIQKNLNTLLEKINGNDDIALYSNNKKMNKEYIENVKKIVDDILSVDHSRVHTFINEGVNGDMTLNLKTVEGNATVVWHFPTFGLHGYDLGGTHFKGKGYDFFTFKYQLDNGSVLYSLHDTDIQPCYVLMNDDEALLIDTDMYGDITKAVKDLIGNRSLSIYITHPHGDHTGGLSEFLPTNSPIRQDIKNNPGRSVTGEWTFPEKSALDDGQLKKIYYPSYEGTSSFAKELTTSKKTIEEALDEFKSQGVEIVRTGEKTSFSVAGRDFVVCQMVGHSLSDVVLIDKTDHIMFAGDITGTESVLGGYGINSASYKDILASINHLLDDYGSMFDYYFQGHVGNRIPKDHIATNNKTLVEEYLKHGKAVSMDGRQLIISNGKMITSKEDFTAIETIDMYQYGGACANINRYGRKDATISILDDTVSMNVKNKHLLNATTTNTESSIMYESSDTKVATVDKDGKIIAVGKGECTITLSTPLTENFEPATESIKVKVYQISEKDEIRSKEDAAVEKLEDIVNANLNQYYDYKDASGRIIRITKLQNNLYHVDEDSGEKPIAANNNTSSMYFYIGENDVVMVDGGNGESANANFSNEGLAKIKELLVGEKELHVVITHLHGDHIGYFKDEKSIPTIGEKTKLYINELDLQGLDSQVKQNYEVVSFKNGENLKVGDFTFEIVGLAGHTEGSCAIIDRESEIIFTGDAIGSGTVWMFGEDNLEKFAPDIENFVKVLEGMENPIIYCGHRGQQRWDFVHANKIAVNEIGKEYVKEMSELVKNIKAGKYSVNKNYPFATDDRVAIYSLESDLNHDGAYPGIFSVKSGVDKIKNVDVDIPTDKDDTIEKEEIETPTVDKETEKKPTKVKTSDMTNIAPYAVVALFSGALLVSLRLRKKESR